jgi:hypothetical protein
MTRRCGFHAGVFVGFPALFGALEGGATQSLAIERVEVAVALDGIRICVCVLQTDYYTTIANSPQLQTEHNCKLTTIAN